jgi:hypothetical protein
MRLGKSVASPTVPHERSSLRKAQHLAGSRWLSTYKDKVSQFVNPLSRKGSTVAGSVAMLNQGHASLFATGVA